MSDKYFEMEVKLNQLNMEVISGGLYFNMTDFSKNLATRFKYQMDGQGSAEEFCDKYVSVYLEYAAIEEQKKRFLELDMDEVELLSPGWINSFWQYIFDKTNWSLSEALYRIRFLDASYVKHCTCMDELQSVDSLRRGDQ